MDNTRIFAKHATHNDAGFKFGDQLVHMPSGTSGIVLAVSADKICWKPDSRIKHGGIWIENNRFRYDV